MVHRVGSEVLEGVLRGPGAGCVECLVSPLLLVVKKERERRRERKDAPAAILPKQSPMNKIK